MPNYDGKPQRQEGRCSICDKEAIALFVDDKVGNHAMRSSVEWCMNGHVVILQDENPPKLVYEFGEDPQCSVRTIN